MPEVGSPSQAYLNQVPKWQMCDDLCHGTAAMRDRTTTYLPMEPKESAAAYALRVERTFLHGAFKKTIENLTGRAFATDPVIEGANDQWQEWLDDIDLSGNKLAVFARECFQSSLRYGMTNIVADYPPIPSTATLADERAAGARPYLYQRNPKSLIGWRIAVKNGRETIERVRFSEITAAYANQWDDDGHRERVRVMVPGRWEIWEKGANAAWTMIDSGAITTQEVPVIPCYFERLAPFVAQTPLLDLAWTNVVHWQSYSDQRNILRIARVGMLFGKGMTADDVGGEFVIGPNRALLVSSTEADLKYVEHQGAAIGAGRQDLVDLEDRMAAYGAEALSQKPGSITATGRALDSKDATSSLGIWVTAVEDAINEALEVMAEFAQTDNAPSVRFNRDFGIMGETSDLDQLFKARTAGEISREAYLSELKRRGVLADEYDPEEDKALIEDEGPSLAELASQQPPQPGQQQGGTGDGSGTP